MTGGPTSGPADRQRAAPQGSPAIRRTRPLARAAFAVTAGAAAAVSAAVPGCADVAAVAPAEARWSGDIDALLASACGGCHGPAGPGPDVTRYRGVTACRADRQPYARAGDPGSLILTILDRPDHARALAPDARAHLARWVLQSKLEFASSLAHPPGFVAPSATGGDHGARLQAAGFTPIFDAAAPGACARCHAAPEASGGAVACAACHAGDFGPTACGSCHGTAADPRPRRNGCDPPERQVSAGLHALHAAPGASYPAASCGACHLVPARASDPGHARDPGGRASVRFDPEVSGGAAYDPATRTCTGVRCHDGQPVTWTSSAAAGHCDTCHGDPPADSNHGDRRCALCHAAATGPDDQPRASTHLDGRVEVGQGCDGCHPGAVLPGRGAGAHPAHLGAGRFAAGFACAACHRVPAATGDPGHVDHPLPAEVHIGGAAAIEGGRSPVLDAASGRCADVACHGAGLDGGTATTPPWTGTSGAIACGACHGLPPRSVRGGAGLHPPTGAADCGACHRTTAGEPITVFTATITVAGRQAHINGCVDLAAGCTP